MKDGGSPVFVFIAGVVVLAVAALMAKPPSSGLPVLGEVGAFSLTERSGRAFTEKDVAGRVWVADFIFTHCAGPCPVLATQTSILQNTESKEVRYVTFTVDPERDTPEVLRAFADQHGAEPERWAFLTGPWETIDALVKDRFHLTARKEENPKPGFEVLHDLRMVLVDRKGRIRGYYIVCTSDYLPSAEELAKLRRDLGKLLRSGE